MSVKTKIISVRIPVFLDHKLDFLASILQKNKSELIREALFEYVRKKEEEIKKKIG